MPNLQVIQTRAQGADAKGIVPPLMRATAHTAFMISMVLMETDERPRPYTNEELIGELDHIEQHWTIIGRPTYIPAALKAEFQVVTDTLPVLRTSIGTDNRDVLKRNLQKMLQNLVSLGCAVDQAAFGLPLGTGTDAGTTL